MKKYLVIWKEGRNLSRTRQYSYDTKKLVNEKINNLISENKPYKIYELIGLNWF